jgi:hypothetical protein
MSAWMVAGLPTGNLARHAMLLTAPLAASSRGFSLLLSRLFFDASSLRVFHLLAVDDRIGVCRMANSTMDSSLYLFFVLLSFLHPPSFLRFFGSTATTSLSRSISFQQLIHYIFFK